MNRENSITNNSHQQVTCLTRYIIQIIQFVRLNLIDPDYNTSIHRILNSHNLFWGFRVNLRFQLH